MSALGRNRGDYRRPAHASARAADVAARALASIQGAAENASKEVSASMVIGDLGTVNNSNHFAGLTREYSTASDGLEYPMVAGAYRPVAGDRVVAMERPGGAVILGKAWSPGLPDLEDVRWGDIHTNAIASGSINDLNGAKIWNGSITHGELDGALDGGSWSSYRLRQITSSSGSDNGAASGNHLHTYGNGNTTDRASIGDFEDAADSLKYLEDHELEGFSDEQFWQTRNLVIKLARLLWANIEGGPHEYLNRMKTDPVFRHQELLQNPNYHVNFMQEHHPDVEYDGVDHPYAMQILESTPSAEEIHQLYDPDFRMADYAEQWASDHELHRFAPRYEKVDRVRRFTQALEDTRNDG
jgi:hypothetical protein